MREAKRGKAMKAAYRREAPEIIRNYLSYMATIRGKSQKTVEEYYLDLRTFFRYIKQSRGLVPPDAAFADIPVGDVTLDLIKSVTLSDAYDFLQYLASDRPNQQNSPATTYGNNASTRARKVSSLRAFYKYLTDKVHLLDANPIAQLDVPKIKKSLPKYLTLDDSVKLLSAVDGENRERDFCILTLFLNCGLRVSELVGINLTDIQDDRLRVVGKGNKERTVYLNDACTAAINAYLPVRIAPVPMHKHALFISNRRQRINVQTVKWLVKRHLSAAGLDTDSYSAHKLRHTAATLMYQNGVDVRTLKDVLGHESLDTTMIYTHISDDNMKNAARMNPLADVKPTEKPPGK